MLQPSENLAYYGALRGRVLESAALLRDEKPREWLCLSGDYMIVVRWQQGVLGIGVDETEYGVYQDIKIVGLDKEEFKQDNKLHFNRVKEFMDWTYDDDVCLDIWNK